MSKSARQKLKLLYLKDILLRESDEEHPLNSQALIEKLDALGIEAERKSIYNDIALLGDYGIDVIKTGGAHGGYFVGSGDFELAELKLLVDAVQSSHFISAKKSDSLIRKLSSLTNRYDENKLKRQVYSVNRVKSGNESILITVDTIHDAIQKNREVGFLYMAWSPEKKLVPKHDGKRYRVSPIALIWDDEYYYLLGIDSETDTKKNFRVDKIKDIEALSEARADISPVNIAEYANKLFGMFSGEDCYVTVRVPNEKIGIFLDRFGTDISVLKLDNENVSIHTEVAVSGQFYGWIASLGNDIEILGGEKVREGYISFLKENLNTYGG
ncbi:MAG: WYL domain-containing protein [Lachnospiraceae bacterium]|nr:WYL domain-containing protein [Lachnospiraceae bacterium]